MTKTKLLLISLGLLFTIFSCQKQDIDAPENKVPISDAGLADTITLPIDSVKLNGSGTDTDGNVVAYLWSQVSGPNAATIVNPGSVSTIIKNFTQGIYKFQLMVTDNKGATGVDTVSVIVNPGVIQTLTLQPDNNSNEYGITNLNGQDESGTGPEISIDAWTNGGAPWILRNIFKFDLSQIPANATIKSANLYLYSNPLPSTGNLIDANFGTDNSLLLQQVTSDWSTTNVGWFNQPSTSTTNQITIPSTTQSILDLNIDVTAIVSSMISNNANYGFLLKLENEVIYNSRIFVSSYNTTYPEKHPKLVVVYQ
jgi:hypothetical protein